MKTLWNIILRKEAKVLDESDEDDENKPKEDFVTKWIGSFGVYQAIVCIVAGLARFIPVWNLLSVIFITPPTEFECKEFINNVTIEVEKSKCYEDCVKYEYYETVFRRTLVSGFGLICERAWMQKFSYIVMLLSVLFGSLLYGWVSDRHGRRNAIRLSTFFGIILMFFLLYSPNIWTFITVRAIIGTTSGGILVISTVYILEVIGSKYRESAVSWILISDGIAAALLPVFAFYTSTWDIFLFDCEVASVFIFVLVLGLPDTPRWLIANAKIDKSFEVIGRAARWNKRETTHLKEDLKIHCTELHIDEKKRETNYRDLLTNWKISLKTISIFLLFTQGGISFSGLNEYLAFVEPDIYMSLVVLGLMQILVSLLSVVFNNIARRKTLIMILLFITSASMVLLAFLSKSSWVAAIISIIGWSSSIIFLTVIYIYTIELYPTSLRNMAVGLGYSGFVLGGLIMYCSAGVTPKWVVPTILAAVSSLASTFCIFISETKGRLLKDTVHS